ncbi:MAG: VTT domain-containing protein, partial [Desulfatitalea sp.]|nr:VTT domain-containing protein [Desulfatitalea sp.]
RMTGERLRRGAHLFQRRGFWPLVQTRFLPIPFVVVNFGAALAGVRPALFFSAALAGLIPSTLIHTGFIAALLDAQGHRRAVLLGCYAASFVVLNVAIGAFWLKRDGYRKLVSFVWATDLLKALIRRLDQRLRRKFGIFEYSIHPDCIFRVHVARTDRSLPLKNGVLPKGTLVLELHFWNERIPAVPEAAMNVSQAIQTFRMSQDAFRELAHCLTRDPRMAGVKAVGGLIPFFDGGAQSPAERMFARLGLHVVPAEAGRGFWRRIGKQMHGWMMMWAFNPAALKQRSLFRLRWADCWVTADEFVRLHAGGVDTAQVNGSIKSPAHPEDNTA